MIEKRIKKVLLCKPFYFDTLDYAINPWMKQGKLNKDKALTQWNQLVTVYKNLGITVEIISQQKGNPDMVFAADQGIVTDKKIIISRFWYKERRQESVYYKAWFRKKGYSVITLPNSVFFEGNGDSFIWNNKLFIGIGFRANDKTCRVVGKILEKEVIPLEMQDPKFYHLDIAFLPLNNKTVFYYPPAFTKKTQEKLKKMIPNLLELSEAETDGFCANSIVTNHHVIHQKGNDSFKKKLTDLGYTSIEVDANEFMKSGGGIHCLTNILEEETREIN